MSVRLIRKSENIEHGWSGGNTSEIFLWPEGSSWQKKDFQIRISAAVTTLGGAPFTDFSGFTRHISPTEGRMHIIHRGHHERVLDMFDVDTFDGAWDTWSEGLYHDFNLLHTYDRNGRMQPVEANQVCRCPAGSFSGVFAAMPLDVIAVGQTYVLSAGDFLLVDADKDLDIEVKAFIKTPGFFVTVTR